MAEKGNRKSSDKGSGNKPVSEIRCGRLRLSLWLNKTEEGQEWISVTITRLFKQGNEWKSSSSFGKDDLLVLAHLLPKAFDNIVELLATRPANTPAADNRVEHDGTVDDAAIPF